ncbi:hypothetical protein QTP70_018752 [Hemibagrus guttatus]|uniref:Reverse transcriptase domain-containing protein n=1 Tax=Hemibagrus guttatus TaxID=175788 RepID=A0AAE0Q7V6_9TELE|nr:hypothetical protein QTP70_018752 [Hemibagrus guttatus]
MHMVPDYPLSEDKARGIDKILSALLDQGVVVPVHSSYNTPVNPVPKPNVVHSSLQDLILPEGAVVLQYADDLLISAETADICKEATWSLLNRLAQQGFKVSQQGPVLQNGDESKFEVLFGKLGRHVIRTKEDKDNPSCYQRSVQKPASLMVWGCMSACGMGSLHIWKGTINAESLNGPEEEAVSLVV